MNKQRIIDRLVEVENEVELPGLLKYIFGDNIDVKLWYSLKDCQGSIDELNLSVRSQNALKRAKIMTIDNLIDRLNEGNLKGIRNLGKKSYSEVQTKILVYGYEKLSISERRDFFAYLLKDYQ